ncbi:MAG: LamG-like jellyroll fold domain-containing protein [Bacteroidales bacterium]|nr:LamG-like jellyroll fold domain-containing protein [Bacteroidales bacterium]
MKKIYNNLQMLLMLAFLTMPFMLTGQSNQYLHFDGEDDFVILNEAGQYVTGTTALSITGWFYCDELAYGQGYMGFRSGSGDGEFYLIQLNNGVMECRLKSTTGLHEYVAPANTAIPQVWQHFAWVYDGSSVILYVNGVMNGSSSASGTFSSSTVPFGIGKSLLGGFNFVYGGRIDEVSVWDKALDQTEIQDMIDNELSGSEPNLQLYYKFNQGEPGGNNTSITHLVSELGSPERDAELQNFALTGNTSNFGGTLDPGYQAISFPQIPNHLTTDPPFELEATATSGLEVFFEVISGPATIDGNTCTLTGEQGEVVIEATQPGNSTYDPADPVINTFMAIDASLNVPNVDARSPLAGDVYVPELGYIQLAAYIDIDYPELFEVSDVEFTIGGSSLTPTDWGGGFYSGWWPVPAHGNYTFNITATNNYGASYTESVNINVVSEVSDMQVQAVDDVWLNTSNTSEVVIAELPSYLGAFDEIVATLEVTCPPGGCGEWDRVASIDARGHDGKWIEIIRYITPYGTACSHTIDLTDYMSILQGKVSFRLNCATLDNGYYYDLTFDFNAGTPAYNYSNIDIIWWDTYQFGDYANLQPVENVLYSFPENAEDAKLKLVSTGHGWGDNNSQNAAEFYEATHHIWVNGEETFEQYNWYECNPNPDACQPQSGTWFYPRAGWCPGAIAQWFDYSMTSYVGEESLDLGYVFFEDYIDYCHPNHPDCVSGTTCPDCNDGFNPHLIVACNLLSFSDMPIDSGAMVSIDENIYQLGSFIKLYPNPTEGVMNLEFNGKARFGEATVSVVGMRGKVYDSFIWHGETTSFDLSHLSKGVYFVKIKTEKTLDVEKVVVQ